jgi:hypothetical protein
MLYTPLQDESDAKELMSEMILLPATATALRQRLLIGDVKRLIKEHAPDT